MLGQGKFKDRVGVRVSLGLRVRIIVRVRLGLALPKILSITINPN